MWLFAWLPLTLLLLNCSGGGSSPPPPPPTVSWPVPAVDQWASGFGQNPTPNVGTSFLIPGGNGIHYVYTPISAADFTGTSSLTLVYTISGDASFGINDPQDIPPPQVTLFVWQAGDNLSCQGAFADYRMFSNQRSPVANGTYTLTAPLNQANWHNCNGQPIGLSQALVSPAYAGFTLGGAYFDGHGVYTTSGSATFTINSFSIQ